MVRKVIAACVLVLLVMAFTESCGRKAPPLPPETSFSKQGISPNGIEKNRG